MNQIDAIRAQNYARQVAAIRDRQQSASQNRNVGVYSGRDARTGLRQITTADGGIAYTRYNSNAKVETGKAIPAVAVSVVIGGTGSIDAKPSGAS